ncbi:MAG: hypothetical protein ACOCSK_01725 [Rhodothermales bacterium]
MADDKNQEQLVPGAPILQFPLEETVVNCRSIRFVWEKAEGATAYFLEVATDTSFENVIFEKNVGDASNVVVEGAFPDDEATYFWRVFAGNEHGWSHGENIEAFICGSEEQLKAEYVQPDLDEAYGPAARLFKGAAVEAAADVTDDEDLLRLEEEMGVANEGIEAKQIIGLILAVIVALILIVVIVFTYASVATQTERRAAEARGEYPELVENQRAARELLERYEIIDSEEGRYRIPIDRAMELIVDENEGQGGPPELQRLRRP